MDQSGERVSIELIAITPVGQEDQEVRASGEVNRWTVLVASLAVLSAFVLVGMSIPERPDDVSPLQGAGIPASTETGADWTVARQLKHASRAEAALGESGDLVPWSGLPEDHEPIIATRPGSGEPVFGRDTDEALVYVSSLGRPTVIDLDTGNVSSVIFAPSQRGESFGVEFGTAVPLSEPTDNASDAAPTTIAFFTIPEGPATVSDLERAAAAPGPFLCLSDMLCQVTGWQGSEASRGGDEIRYMTRQGDPELFEVLFGDSWTTDGFNRRGPEGTFDGLRIPTPLNNDAWIVHQPEATSDPS